MIVSDNEKTVKKLFKYHLPTTNFKRFVIMPFRPSASENDKFACMNSNLFLVMRKCPKNKTDGTPRTKGHKTCDRTKLSVRGFLYIHNSSWWIFRLNGVPFSKYLKKKIHQEKLENYILSNRSVMNKFASIIIYYLLFKN